MSLLEDPARAGDASPPNVGTPARAIKSSNPRLEASARAIKGSDPNPVPPARAVRHLTPRGGTPARAMEVTRTVGSAPARAKEPTTPIAMSPARAKLAATPRDGSPARAGNLDYIRMLGELLDDLEKIRVSNGNRIGAIERDGGNGVPHLQVIAEGLAHVEHQTVLEIQRAWRKHPLASWAKEYRGCGEKSIARLIAITGDPADRPNVAKLWAYCGHGNPHLKKRAGMSQADAFKLGNPRAKKQVWLIATSMLKAGNREYYDAARFRYANRDWTDGHKHAAALRYAGKMFLRDLWVAARAGHSSVDNQATPARAGQSVPDAQALAARAGHEEPDVHVPAARAGRRPVANHNADARAGHVNSDDHNSVARAGREGTL